MLPRLDAILKQLADEEAWVLGLAAKTSDPTVRSAVAADVAKLYASAYADQWQAALEAWQLHRPADADALARLNTQLAAADSPLRKLLDLVRAGPPGRERLAPLVLGHMVGVENEHQGASVSG